MQVYAPTKDSAEELKTAFYDILEEMPAEEQLADIERKLRIESQTLLGLCGKWVTGLDRGSAEGRMG